MANRVYPRALEGFMDNSIDWDGDTIRVALVRGYTYSDTHKFLSDAQAAGASIVATDAMTGKVNALTTDGVGAYADANDDTFGVVAAGAAIPHILVYKDTGSAASSRLIVFIDTATGLPVTPNGSTINLTWAGDPNRIFRLN